MCKEDGQARKSRRRIDDDAIARRQKIEVLQRVDAHLIAILMPVVSMDRGSRLRIPMRRGDEIRICTLKQLENPAIVRREKDRRARLPLVQLLQRPPDGEESAALVGEADVNTGHA